MRRRRDELGRFAEKVVPRRDSLGRFAARKVPSRKAAPRKVEPRKVALKKVESRKVAPKKVAPRKVAPKKVEPRKVVPKKVALRKVAPKKVEPRKVAPKKVALRKVAPKKVEPRKVEPRKVAPKKVEPRKVVPKKVAPRKVAPKKVEPRKVVPKKVEPRKAVPKKVEPRKAAARKVAARKAAARKATARKAAARKAAARKTKRRREKKILPGVPARARQAEAEILAKLTDLMEVLAVEVEGSAVAVKSFVNADGSVDGELKVADLPDDMRSEEGAAVVTSLLSEVFRAFRPFPESPSTGGRFWVSFAMRFGPQNETEVGQLVELYKKFRGLYQVDTYPAAAWHPTPIQLALTTGLKTIVESVARKQGFPPSVILIRFTWTPDGKRPGRLAGTAGGGR